MKLLDIAGKTDANGKRHRPDGAINADDRTIIGDPNPKFTAGWHEHVHASGRFRLSSMMDAVYGNKILNLNNVRLEAGQPGDEHHRRPLSRRVDADEHRTREYPRINFTPGTTGSDITSDLLEDGSFLRLRNVTLDVALPERFVSRYGFVEHAGLRHRIEPDDVDALQRLQSRRQQPRHRQREPRRRRRAVSAGEELHVRHQHHLLSARTPINAQANEDRRRARCRWPWRSRATTRSS